MIKTVTTISTLPADNDFKIHNVEDYALIEVTAQRGKAAASMSFPWAHSIPYMDISVQDAISKCEETVRASLQNHLDEKKRREDAMTPAEKFMRFVRREFAFFKSRAKIEKERC
jgi:hypothetical protein